MISTRFAAGLALALLSVSATAQTLANFGSRQQPVMLVAPPPAAQGKAARVTPKLASLTENFDNIALLGGNGWSLQNLSTPVGSTNWFQGSNVAAGGPFDAFNGAANAYIGANYNNTGNTGTISNWLITPVLDFGNAATFTFFTRKASPDSYPDRLQVRLSTNGASTNAGINASTVGDFTTVLLEVNPSLTLGVYPTAWTQYTISHATHPQLPHSGTGRLAFRYFVTGAGLSGTNSDYIGIDAVTYTSNAAEYQVGGNVSGAVGSGLTISLNGGAPMAVGNGAFTFPGYLLSGTAYTVAVETQPTVPAQTCTVTNGSGNANGTVTNIGITCVTDTFSIGGSVTGLAGSGLVLQLNGGNDLPIAADGAFTFPAELDDLSNYTVTVGTQPEALSQTCSVTNGSGTLASADVSDVQIDCVTDAFSVGGTVTGLQGTGLVLQNNLGDDLPVAADGGFTFATVLTDGSDYAVSVAAQPGSLSQTCTVSNGNGTLAGADVTNVTVSCVTDVFSVGGTVVGLQGTGLVLQNNLGDDLPIAADGDFTFATALTDGSDYAVSVATQPGSLSQTCTVSNGNGTLAGANVTNVTVDCVTDTFTIGGNVSGLLGSGLVLQNNAGDDLAIAAAGGFTFATALTDGAAYAVTVSVQPALPAQTCAVSSGSGNLAGANAADVSVVCTTDPFTLTVVSGSGQLTLSGASFAAPLVAGLEDSDGAPVPDTAVTFTAPPAGASATLDDGVQPSAAILTVNTDGDGEAIVIATANAEGGCYGVVASAAGSNSVAFELTNVIPAPVPEIFYDGFEAPVPALKGFSICQP